VRQALGTLPWVEQDTIQTDTKKREVKLNLKDRSRFSEDEIKKALKAQGFPEATVTSAPP
jgi:hypothetical protein